jgi:hypothetical protein
MELLTPIFVLAFLVLAFWLPMEILHKAGFSRWWGVLIPLTGFLGVIIIAIIDWPIRRELAWRRLAAGSCSEEDIALAYSYAIQMEKQGDWKRAISVYETLAQRASDNQEAEYAGNCIVRLRERLAHLETA